MGKSKFLHFGKVQDNPEKSRVLALKSDKNSQSYNEITKIDDFSPLYPPNLRQSIIFRKTSNMFQNTPIVLFKIFNFYNFFPNIEKRL